MCHGTQPKTALPICFHRKPTLWPSTTRPPAIRLVTLPKTVTPPTTYSMANCFLGTYSRREIIGIYSKLTPEITRRGIAGKDFTITTEIPHWQGYTQTNALAGNRTHLPITIRIQRRPPPPQQTEPNTENPNYTFLQEKPTINKNIHTMQYTGTRASMTQNCSTNSA